MHEAKATAKTAVAVLGLGNMGKALAESLLKGQCDRVLEVLKGRAK